ncbi:hypothetical protein BaRGS_00012752 [Batillaria attramentaria]|uniref:Tudor domain-containing protein n=1 Tax=Batillaria attramentaria TaxID=370345 RepID=A0ABD0L9U2_9CAEN
MAGTESMVLFQRGDEEEYDSDAWDDTALIEAYDAAVAPLKAKLAEHTGDSSILDAGHRLTHGTQHKKKKNKKKKSKKKQQVMGWRVGDHCQAVYTEDGEIYEGKIISISPESNTCVVRYLGYGNEEEQSLEDLMPSAVSATKRPKHQRNDSVSCSEMPMPGGGAFGFPHPGINSASSMHLPTMPPPPPPMPTDEAPDENEALCSMLLSWYMSGYHTGYYQGLRQGRHSDVNGSAASAMGPSR